MTEPAHPGLFGSLRSFADAALGGVRARLELFSTEVQEEKQRLMLFLVWVAALVFAGAMLAVFLSITVVVIFWDTARMEALVGVTLFYTLLLGGLAWGFRRHLARQPRPFAATLQELEEDRECLRGGN